MSIQPQLRVALSSSLIKLRTMLTLPRCRVLQRFGLVLILVVVICLGIHYSEIINRHMSPNSSKSIITNNRAMNDTITELNLKMPTQQPKHLLTLFTSWLTTKDKLSVHNNTLRLWTMWLPDIIPVLFTNETDLGKRAISLGWKVLPITHYSCGKVPVLKTMFLESQKHFDSLLYGFANSDILFDGTLKENLQKMLSFDMLIKDKPCLITGRRVNVNFRSNLIVQDEHHLHNLTKKGSLSRVWGEDYFITSKHFPWNVVPNMVIGRVAFDNYLVMVGRQEKVRLIDTTNTLTAIHQTTSDGDMAGAKRPNSKCNVKLINHLKLNQHFRQGYVDCIDLETRRDYRNDISVIKRFIPAVCSR